MIVAITGAGGGIGRRLTERLASDGELVLIDSVAPEEATVFDATSPGGRRPAPIQPEWPYHRTDILDVDALAVAVDGADVIVHLAGWPTGEWEHALEIVRANALGTMSVYEAARRSGVGRVVTASSINAFGTFFWRVDGTAPERDRLPLVEDEPRIPQDPYSLSKGMAEDIGATYARAFGLQSVNLRFAGVWSAERYAAAIEAGLEPTQQWADDLFQWVHIDDVVEGIVLALTAEGVDPGPITLAAGDTKAPEPTRELIRAFRPELESRLREEIPGRASLVSIERARRQLGYRPRFSFD